MKLSHTSTSIIMKVNLYCNGFILESTNDIISLSRERLVIKLGFKIECQDIRQLIFTYYLENNRFSTPEIDQQYYEIIDALGDEVYEKIEPLLTTLLALTTEVSFTEGFNACKMIIRS